MVAGGVRLLIRLIGPLTGCLEKTPSADQRILLRKKVTSAVIFLLILLLFSHIPLYGIHSTTGSDPDPDPDPFYWIRVVLASKRGTFMELGISPVVTYILVMQILIRSKFIRVDYDHRHITSITDLLVAIPFGEALAYVSVFGMFGSVAQLGALNATLLTAQLACFGVVVLLLHEILWTDYFGPGIAPLPRWVPFVPARQWGRRFGFPLEPNEFARALERIRIRRRRNRAARRRASREGSVPEGSY